MTTHWPCIVVTLLSCMLVAAFAAEGKWVLWVLLDGDLRPTSSRESERACEALGHRLVRENVKLTVMCLPDTVDPRVPLGK